MKKMFMLFAAAILMAGVVTGCDKSSTDTSTPPATSTSTNVPASTNK